MSSRFIGDPDEPAGRRGTSVSTSHPVAVTSTSSSSRTPPMPVDVRAGLDRADHARLRARRPGSVAAARRSAAPRAPRGPARDRSRGGTPRQSVVVRTSRAAASTHRRRAPARTAAIAGRLRVAHRLEHAAHVPPSGRPTATIRVRSTQYPSNTPPKSSTTRSPVSTARPVGRACGWALLRPGRHDGVEGRPREARLLHPPIDLARDVVLGTARTDDLLAQDGPRHVGEPRGGVPEDGHLVRVLHHAHALHHALGRHQAAPGGRALRVPAHERGLQPLPPPLGPLPRDAGRLEPDVPGLEPVEQGGEPLLVRPIDPHELRVRRRGVGGEHRQNRGTVPKVREQVKAPRVEDGDGRAAVEVREVRDVRQVGDDHRIDAMRGKGVPHTPMALGHRGRGSGEHPGTIAQRGRPRRPLSGGPRA